MRGGKDADFEVLVCLLKALQSEWPDIEGALHEARSLLELWVVGQRDVDEDVWRFGVRELLLHPMDKGLV